MFKKPLINNQIRSNRLRVIDEAGQQLGVMSLTEALQVSQKRNLDLIQVTEKADPPVCKIMNYGKYLYSEKKQQKKSEQKQKGGEMKGVRLGFNISLHDLEIRVKQAEKFLQQGNKVRVEMKLRGREKALQGFAKEKINKFLEILEKTTQFKVERELKKEARGLTMIIVKT